MLRRLQDINRSVFRLLRDPIPGLPETLPSHHRSQTRVHLRREVHPRVGQQHYPVDAETGHRVPHRLQMAGKNLNKNKIKFYFFTKQQLLIVLTFNC